MRKLLVILTAIAAQAILAFAQQPAGERRGFTITGEYVPRVSEEVAKGPVPRLPEGKPDLSGPWLGGGTIQDIERDGGLKPGELPLLPAAKALRDSRKPQDEPYVRCMPMSVPRTNPFPWRFVHSYNPKGPGDIFVVHELGDGGHTRQIFMDGRKHPDDLLPSWWGHSIGTWEGDTLVIDTIGYNDKFWFDRRGTPHTEQLHTIERWTRLNYGTLTLELTLDDPGTFSRPVNLKFTATAVAPGTELMEYICVENNQYGIAGGYVSPPAK